MRWPRCIALLWVAAVAVSAAVAAAYDEPYGGSRNASYRAAGITHIQNPGPQRVLFVGNSYLYYNDSLHNHLKRIVQELRPKVAEGLKYKSATIGGARLEHHDINWLLAPGKIGVKPAFEVVVLQGGSAEVLSEDSRNVFYTTTKRYADKIRQRGGEPVLYMTHAYVPPHKRAAEDLIDTIAPAYIEAGRAADALVIPVGLAFDASYLQRPAFTLHKAFDGTHPNLRGTYLAACVVYLSLYGGSIDGLSYDYFGRLTEDEISYLQDVATRVTQTFLSRQ